MSGSGVYSGLLWWRMYCVEKNTRNAIALRKSREVSRPLTGRSVKPVQPCSACYQEIDGAAHKKQTFKKSEMWLICGMEWREKPHFSRMTGKMYWYSWHA